MLTEGDHFDAGWHHHYLFRLAGVSIAGGLQPRQYLIGGRTTGASLGSEQLHHHGFGWCDIGADRNYAQNQYGSFHCTHSDAFRSASVDAMVVLILGKVFWQSGG